MKLDKNRNLKKYKSTYGMWNNCAYMIKLAWHIEKSVIWLCVLSAILAVTLNLLELYVTPTILSNVENTVPLSQLLHIILFFVLSLMIIGSIKAYISCNTLFGRVAVRSSLASKIHDKLSITSYPNTLDQKFLKLLDKSSMAVSGNSEATEAIWNTLKDLLENTIGFIIYLTLLSSLNIFIIVITLATTIAGYFISKYINSWGYRHREEEAEYSHKMNYINAKSKDHTFAKDIRIFGMKPWLEEIYASTLRLYQGFLTKAEKIYIWSNIVDILLSVLRNGIAYVYLISLTLSQGLTASEFLLYFTAITGFTSWVSGILSSFSTLHRQSLDISTIREYLDTAEPFKFEDGESINPCTANPYEIELRNVTFRYPGDAKDTISNMNLRIKPGEKLAIVGLNGAGKTTLIKLICGFYDPCEGEVLLNGENIKKYNRRDYYRQFSAVFQQFSLLATTVAGNVAQCEDSIDMSKVKESIAKAGLTEKIESLPKSYNTNLNKEVFKDASELSGGEMQRLMLARALYKDAPIIILDEPTAALDPIAERDIYIKYNDLTNGKTSIYISHRLASTGFCDRILFIENGIIAEEGTHEELLSTGGKYSKLFHIQSRYYQEGGAMNVN